AHFAPAAGALGISHVEFSIPEGTSGNFTFTIPNQTYQKAETIWLELIGESYPPELAGATSLAGPVQVNPGPASRLIATANPTRLAAGAVGAISALVTDAVGNGAAGVGVAAQIQQGSGRLRVGEASVTQSQAMTDSAGRTQFAFISGMMSEMNKILVWAQPPANLPSAEVSILTSLLGDRDLAAYPSPVAIMQRPLTIEYRLDVDSDVSATITDVFGREVWRTGMSAGNAGGRQGFNTISWEGRNQNGQVVAAGVYGLHLAIKANGQTTSASTRFGVKK
ncbi:MAG TPA: hypothetical protein DEB40_12370, partial [Elusimicrobia bacterium]|nr:hypothetical protein [Elusimicrobiota bacterium]HBT62529.1 hypothetical protein [Elusimicrobiota bacterium]